MPAPRVACIEFFCVARRDRLFMRCADSYYVIAGECIGRVADSFTVRNFDSVFGW
jgi:hypothetical protein